MATFIFSQDATPGEIADVMRILAEGQQPGAALLQSAIQSAMCPACSVRVAGASGLCEECTQIAGRLSFEAQVQQADAAMQEDATQPAQTSPDPFGRTPIVVAPEVGESPEHLRNSYIAASLLLRELSFAPDNKHYGELRAVADMVLVRLGNLVSWYSFFGQEETATQED